MGPYAFLLGFYWLIPRQREILRIPFDDFVARVRLKRREPFITVRGLVDIGFLLAGTTLAGIGFVSALAAT